MPYTWTPLSDTVYAPREHRDNTPPLSHLPPGIYHSLEQMMGPNLWEQVPSLVTDDLLLTADAPALSILEEIRQFQSRRDRYARMGLVHKRGILLYGPPGTGKTSVVAQLADLVVQELGGYVLPQLDVMAVQELRRYEPDALIMVVLEDIDARLSSGVQERLLAFLDGDQQVENVVVVATTNYLGALPPRLVNRPSRFDLIREVGMPSPLLREAYLRARIPVELAEEDRAAIVAGSEGLSLAHLKEIVILKEVFDYPVADAVRRVREMATGGGAPDTVTAPTLRSEELVSLLKKAQHMGNYSAPPAAALAR